MPETAMDIIARELRDKDAFKSERDIGEIKNMVLLLSKRKVNAKERHTIVNQRNINTNVLIWDSPAFGVWNTDNWGPDTSGTASSWSTIRVVNPNRTYFDSFNSDLFEDTTSTTATWGTSGSITF